IRDLDGNPIPEEELPFRRVVETGEPVSNVRHSIRWPDGTRRDLLVNGAPLLDDDGAVQSAVFSLADITDRKQSERELERTNTRYRTLVDHFPDGAVFLFDETQTYTLAGGEALETLGLQQSDVIGSTPGELFPADVAETITEHNEIALDGTATEFDVTWGSRQFHLQVIPIFDGEEVTGGMGVAQDVTDRRVAEHRLQTLLERTDNLVY
ncbi:MAG: PAS domain-containing protein, partial [Halobaculum sp.]